MWVNLPLIYVQNANSLLLAWLWVWMGYLSVKANLLSKWRCFFRIWSSLSSYIDAMYENIDISLLFHFLLFSCKLKKQGVNGKEMSWEIWSLLLSFLPNEYRGSEPFKIRIMLDILKQNPPLAVCISCKTAHILEKIDWRVSVLWNIGTFFLIIALSLRLCFSVTG